MCKKVLKAEKYENITNIQRTKISVKIYISAMSARKNQSKFQITALLLVETQILFDFYALR